MDVDDNIDANNVQNIEMSTNMTGQKYSEYHMDDFTDNDFDENENKNNEHENNENDNNENENNENGNNQNEIILNINEEKDYEIIPNNVDITRRSSAMIDDVNKILNNTIISDSNISEKTERNEITEIDEKTEIFHIPLINEGNDKNIDVNYNVHNIELSTDITGQKQSDFHLDDFTDNNGIEVTEKSMKSEDVWNKIKILPTVELRARFEKMKVCDVIDFYVLWLYQYLSFHILDINGKDVCIYIYIYVCIYIYIYIYIFIYVYVCMYVYRLVSMLSKYRKRQ
jgi:hypothetical protein